jgi:hypothetical protein
MFASLFQLYGFHTVPFVEEFFASMLHGPVDGLSQLSMHTFGELEVKQRT